MKVKTGEVTNLKQKNKQLAEELAELQNNANGKSSKEDDSEKCSKLTKVVSNKSKEVTELKTENKVMKERNEEMNKRMNEMSSKVTTLETRNTRLETQVENLIDAVGRNHTKSGKNESAPKSPSRDDSEMNTRPATKCKHNDKAICLRKDTCQFVHTKIVCSSFTKHGECSSQDTCMKRHPHGICNRWKRGVCDKDTDCFYRHPEGEEGSESRKRALSSEQMDQSNKSQKLNEENLKKQEDHFLFKKMMEIEKKLERKEENVPSGWINARWSAANTAHPTFSTQAANLAPSFQTPNHVPAYQTTFAPTTPSGSQWIQQQQPPQQVIYPFPGVQQFQN